MPDRGPIPEETWRVIVENIPIVSVDLVARLDGGVVLGERTNEPAKGEWFVPGGRLHKGETLKAAVHRVAREELGVEVRIDRRLGTYEHHYDVADVSEADGKHYVPTAFVVDVVDGEITPDDQHAAVRVARPPFGGLDLHPYVAEYLRDAGFDVGGEGDRNGGRPI